MKLLYDQIQTVIGSKMVSLTHQNLPLAMFLNVLIWDFLHGMAVVWKAINTQVLLIWV